MCLRRPPCQPRPDKVTRMAKGSVGNLEAKSAPKMSPQRSVTPATGYRGGVRLCRASVVANGRPLPAGPAYCPRDVLQHRASLGARLIRRLVRVLQCE